MQTWHHVLEKSEPQINNINALHGPFRRLLFNSGLTAGRGQHRGSGVPCVGPWDISFFPILPKPNTKFTIVPIQSLNQLRILRSNFQTTSPKLQSKNRREQLLFLSLYPPSMNYESRGGLQLIEDGAGTAQKTQYPGIPNAGYQAVRDHESRPLQLVPNRRHEMVLSRLA